jgi:hypothetical protein
VLKVTKRKLIFSEIAWVETLIPSQALDEERKKISLVIDS